MNAINGLQLTALLALAGLAGGAEMTGDFWVATDGNDAHPGTQDKPFASLARARDAVRTLKKDKPITVFIRGGIYFLKEPLLFGPEDSGTEKFSITYAAAPGEKPVFSGGRAITGWKKGEGGLWTVEIPEVKAGKWYFRQLFVSGRRAVRARSPNAGFFRVVKAGPDNRTSFNFKKGDLRAWRNLDDAELVFLHDWSISRVRIGAVEEAASTVRLADPIGCAGNDMFAIVSWMSAHPRYYVENVPELLDSPGEWYLGCQPGTAVCGNLILGVPATPGASENKGIYPDEGSSGLVIEDNVVYDVVNTPVQCHKATGLTFCRNALFLSSPQGKAFHFKDCEEKTMALEANIVQAGLGPGEPEVLKKARAEAGLELEYRRLLTSDKEKFEKTPK